MRNTRREGLRTSTSATAKPFRCGFTRRQRERQRVTERSGLARGIQPALGNPMVCRLADGTFHLHEQRLVLPVRATNHHHHLLHIIVLLPFLYSSLPTIFGPLAGSTAPTSTVLYRPRPYFSIPTLINHTNH